MRVEKACRALRKSVLVPRVSGEEAPLDLASGRAICACVEEVLRVSFVREGKVTTSNYVLRLAGDVYAFVQLAGTLQVQLSRFYNPNEEAFSRCIAPSYDDPESFSDYSSMSDLDSPRSELF